MIIFGRHVYQVKTACKNGCSPLLAFELSPLNEFIGESLCAQ